ncbi:single-stranded DNA-binding protein [Carboxylicivirga sp. M1479]|uniref:single-stranded DNA-binding protein n=1 Tax=Carboxylicivirga sp. M1479 TaxID=2594476 RepID=UPI001178A0B6|nr:single-stranded DNA-binding protein [Carboxylicivirga sp. M1479]TRX66491.1 single-stranded DNA-binding protein [Carboxylicivirga sp. M1479]
MLKLILNGTLGKDAEIRDVGNRKAINFDVAVSMDYKNANGEKVERTEWIRSVLWRSDKQSTKIAEFLKKGQKILLEGTPSSEGYQSKDGTIKSVIHVNVKELELIK